MNRNHWIAQLKGHGQKGTMISILGNQRKCRLQFRNITVYEVLLTVVSSGAIWTPSGATTTRHGIKRHGLIRSTSLNAISSLVRS
jgi:hypothetical protein